jgi:hypothetical protein
MQWIKTRQSDREGQYISHNRNLTVALPYRQQIKLILAVGYTVHSQGPLPKGEGLVSHPKVDTIGGLTTAYRLRIYRSRQEKSGTSRECS